MTATGWQKTLNELTPVRLNDGRIGWADRDFSLVRLRSLSVDLHGRTEQGYLSSLWNNHLSGQPMKLFTCAFN